MRPTSSPFAARSLIWISLTTVGACSAQQPLARAADLQGRVVLPSSERIAHRPDVVLWLAAAGGTHTPDPPSPGRFTLVQKDRAFHPHLLVIPVGSTVSFPNDDPFFHNVFSLFNGKRFDLGLYEAGSTRTVVFSREGVSYIFCNIHPEMSAVVISLSTPFHATANASGAFTINGVPAGDYDLHTWIEGTPQPVNDSLTRRVHISADEPNSIVVDVSHAPPASDEHLNKFGKPYGHEVKPY